MNLNNQIRATYDTIMDNSDTGGDHHWIYTQDTDFVLENYGDGIVYVENLDTEQSEIFNLNNMTANRFVSIIRDWSDVVAAA